MFAASIILIPSSVGPYMGGALATALYYFLFQSKPVEKAYTKFDNTQNNDQVELEAHDDQ